MTRLEAGSIDREDTPMLARAPRVSHSAVRETDGYTQSVAGIKIEAIRVGQGRGPNHVHTVAHPQFTATSCSIGMPMLTGTTIDDDRVVVVRINAAELGSRWCGIDLVPGMVFVYSAGAQHTAVNHPGVGFTFVTMARDQVHEVAERLGLSMRLPERGSVTTIGPSSTTQAVAVERAYMTLSVAMRDNVALAEPVGDDAVCATTEVLAGPQGARGLNGRQALLSRLVVRNCIEYAESIERIPSIGELCLAAHVSERRLRQAFHDQFNVPPSRFFRAWALDHAHRRLLNGGPDDTSVTRVATEIGFHHLGRFSAYYRTLYGQAPSTTLRASALSARSK